MNSHSSRSILAAGVFLFANIGAFAAHSFDSLSDGCPFCSGGLYGDIGALPPEKPAALSVPPDAPSTTKLVALPVTSVEQPTPTTKPLPPFPEVKKGTDGFWQVSFQNLASFAYAPPPPDAPVHVGALDQIPENVRALDGKRVRVSGYMMPLKLEKDGFAKEFLLVRIPLMCCYGTVPEPTEWIVVRMKGRGAAPLMHVPLNFYGTLHVGQVCEENIFAGIYQLDGDKVSVN